MVILERCVRGKNLPLLTSVGDLNRNDLQTRAGLVIVAGLSSLRLPACRKAVVCPVLKLRLYVANPTFEATAAIAQVHSLLQKLGASYALEVLDVNEHREKALEDEVPFTPLLLRLEPLPVLRIGMPAANLPELEAGLQQQPLQVLETAQVA